MFLYKIMIDSAHQKEYELKTTTRDWSIEVAAITVLTVAIIIISGLVRRLFCHAKMHE